MFIPLISFHYYHYTSKYAILIYKIYKIGEKNQLYIVT